MRLLNIKLVLVFIIGLSICSDSLKAETSELSIERQLEIIANYAIVSGIRTGSPATTSGDPNLPVHTPRCGTPAILDFYQNYNQIDRRLLAAAGIQVDRLRPQMSFQFDSPGGRVRIHYEKTGDSAVWQAGVDSDGDGVPNYVEDIADVGDNVYNHLRDSLGYTDSLGNLLIIVDTLCEFGGDERIDIYLSDLSRGLYGQTWGEPSCVSAIGTRSMPAWIEIDNDFQTLDPYVGRPLEAAKVTIAHEMFHVLHFAIDAKEASAWFEMTATWLEEEIYDEVNDYYLGFEFFYKVPYRSIQSVQDFHLYASSVWPLFLSEKYGPFIIRDSWLYAARDTLPTYLEGLDVSIKAADTAANLSSAFNEFWVWNYFTGKYASTAPNDIGFQEKAAYPVIPLDSMDVQKFFPINVLSSKFKQEYNAATYVRLDELQSLLQDYWRCNRHQIPTDPTSPCVGDSTFIVGDTILSVFLGADSINSGGWSLSLIYQLNDLPDSHFVESYPNVALQPSQLLDVITGYNIDFRNYNSITLVFSNTTTNNSLYQHNLKISPRYNISDHSGFISELANLPPAVLTPYPNPAVVSELDGEGMKFRLQVPTDSTSFVSLTTAKIVIDIYNIAGEYLIQLEGGFTGEDRLGANRVGVYEVTWDMKNQSGNDVASGVYIAYARLYDKIKLGELLAEGEVKVAVIR